MVLSVDKSARRPRASGRANHRRLYDQTSARVQIACTRLPIVLARGDLAVSARGEPARFKVTIAERPEA